MKKLLLALHVYLLTSYAIASDTLASDFYFYLLPTDYLSSLEKDVKGNFKESIKQIHISKPYATEVKNINVDLNYSYKVQPNGVNNYLLNIDIDNLNVSIGDIVTDDAVHPQVNGAYVTIQVHGECHGLYLKRSGSSAKLSAGISVVSVANKLFAKVNNVNLDLSGDWSVDIEHCAGPSGYEEAIKSEILKLTENKDFTSAYISQIMQDKANQIASDLTSQVLKEQQQKISNKGEITITPEQVDLSREDGVFYIKGKIYSDFTSKKDKSNYLPFHLQQNSQYSGMYVSQEFLKAFSSQLNTHGIYQQTFHSQQLDGLKKLQGNRFYQFFLFPDLMNFSKKADFLLNLSLKQDPKVSIVGGQDGYLWFQADGEAIVDMLAPKGNEHLPYMQLNSQVKARGWLSVNNRQLSIGFYKPEMDLSYQWDKDYVSKYKPYKSFYSSYFRDQLRSSVETMRFRYDLPQFTLGQMGALVPEAIIHNEQWLQLIYKAK